MTKCTYRGSANHLVHYHTNGTGRDNYIRNDNGGFCKMYEPIKYPKVGTFTSGRMFKETRPTIHSK